MTGVTAPLRGDGPGLKMDGPPTLARDSLLGALSDEAGPQPASPTSSEQPAATSQQRGANSKKIRALDCSLLTIRFTRDRKRYEIAPIAERDLDSFFNQKPFWGDR